MTATHLRQPPSDNAIPTEVPADLVTKTILAANTNRVGFSIFNGSNSRLFVRCATGPATVDNYTQIIEPDDTWEGPKHVNYRGIVTGIWFPVADNDAHVTEYTP